MKRSCISAYRGMFYSVADLGDGNFLWRLYTDPTPEGIPITLDGKITTTLQSAIAQAQRTIDSHPERDSAIAARTTH